MIWALNALPTTEELIWIDVQAPLTSSCSKELSKESRLRFYLTTLFATFGLVAGLQAAFSDRAPEGRTRLVEVNLSERKTLCRTCDKAANSSNPTQL